MLGHKLSFNRFYFKDFFLMRTIFQVFIEFITILFLSYVLVFCPHEAWDPSSPAGTEPTLPALEGPIPIGLTIEILNFNRILKDIKKYL